MLPRAVLALCLVLFALPAGASSLQPFRVDEGGACAEQEVDLAARPGGGFVATWLESVSDDPWDLRVLARRFGPAGAPLGEPIVVEPGEARAQAAAVAVQPDGSFLVAWKDLELDTQLGHWWARVFAADGAAASDPIELQDFATLEGGVAATVDTNGDYLVLWTTGEGIIPPHPNVGEAYLNRISPAGALLGRDQAFAGAVLGGEVHGPALDAGHGVTAGAVAETQFTFALVHGLAIDDGTAATTFSVFDATTPDVAVLPGGLVATAWRGRPRPADPPPVDFDAVFLRWSEDGVTVRETGRVDDGSLPVISGPALAASPAGELLVVWVQTDATEQHQLVARAYLPNGSPAGEPRVLATGAPGGGTAPFAPAVAWTGGEWTVLWEAGGFREPDQPFAPQGCFSSGIHGRSVVRAQLLPLPALALRGGRFEARVTWRDPYNGGSGTGEPLPLTDDTGTFWFFREGNRELMVKVLDGRGVNGAFWVFYGSTTSVAFDLVVTDTETGDEVVYRNPPFHLASRGDTGAFPQPAPAGEALAGASWLAAEPAVAARATPPARFGQSLPALPTFLPSRLAGPLTPAVPSFDCDDPDEPGLCLGASYEVTVRWFDPFNGGSGEGRGVPLSDDSGYFWFFHQDNAELLVKILPGGPVNGFDWVFYGSLTNVAFEMRVYDWNTGFERLYRNPPREFRSVGDTRAFPPTGGCASQCPAGGEPVCGNDGLTYANACVAECSGRSVLHPGACTWEPPE